MIQTNKQQKDSPNKQKDKIKQSDKQAICNQQKDGQTGKQKHYSSSVYKQ